jgi:hypothetical protein
MGNPTGQRRGGGVEDTDVSVVAALHRELAEELAAEVTHGS